MFQPISIQCTQHTTITSLSITHWNPPWTIKPWDSIILVFWLWRGLLQRRGVGCASPPVPRRCSCRHLASWISTSHKQMHTLNNNNPTKITFSSKIVSLQLRFLTQVNSLYNTRASTQKPPVYICMYTYWCLPVCEWVCSR